jgi:hypothetical protein
MSRPPDLKPEGLDRVDRALLLNRLVAFCRRPASNNKQVFLGSSLSHTSALFSLPQSSKFFHSLSITSIFNHLHGVLNVGKKITNYTVELEITR